MTECKIVASRLADAAADKRLVALARLVKKNGARCARKKVEGNEVKVGIVSPDESADALAEELRKNGWAVKFATPRPEPQEPEEPEERLPHPLNSETREARLGCAWGSAEMETIAQSIGMTTAQLALLADSAGRTFGHFRFNPWNLWSHLGGGPLNCFRDPQPKSAKLLKMMEEKYGAECEAVKFYRLQTVGFRPELLKKRRAK